MGLSGLRTPEVIPNVYRAAIRTPGTNSDTIERWILTNDPAEIAQHSDEDVIFARDSFELVAQLEKLNPAPAGFSYIRSSRIENAAAIDVALCPIAITRSKDKILDAVKKYGRIIIDNRELVGLPERHLGTGYELLNDEIYVQAFYCDNRLNYVLIYDPKRVARVRASRQSGETSRTRYGVVNLDMLCNVAAHIISVIGKRYRDLVYYYFGHDDCGSGLLTYSGIGIGAGRKNVCSHLVRCIHLAETLQVGRRLLKDRGYRDWLKRIRPYIKGMHNNKDMLDLAVVLEEQCKKAKLRVPSVEEVLKKKRSVTT